MKPSRILFACVHNAGRSQMAEAFLNQLADPARAVAISAGTEPGERVHPEVVLAMREVGIELGAVRLRQLTDELARSCDMLVTLGCGESCPLVSGPRREDWPLPDPKGQSLEAVRAIRDDVRRRIEVMVRDEGWARS